MAIYVAEYTLTDARGNTTNVRYNLGDFPGLPATEYPLVLIAADQIKDALGNATDAEITKEVISMVNVNTSAEHPITGNADITDEVLVSIKLESATPQSVSLRIPAPNSQIVPDDGVEVNRNSALLTAFVTNIQEHARFGPNADVEAKEPVEITNAYWRSVSKK